MDVDNLTYGQVGDTGIGLGEATVSVVRWSYSWKGLRRHTKNEDREDPDQIEHHDGDDAEVMGRLEERQSLTSSSGWERACFEGKANA